MTYNNFCEIAVIFYIKLGHFSFKFHYCFIAHITSVLGKNCFTQMQPFLGLVFGSLDCLNPHLSHGINFKEIYGDQKFGGGF